MRRKNKEKSRRNVSRIVRLTAQEHEDISRLMVLANTENFSKYLRDAALNRKITKGRNYAQIISQFKYFSNNFNQATLALNHIKKCADKTVFDFSLIEKALQDCAEQVARLKEIEE
ncbi:MAG: hypothetical protein EON54_03425 [Alcaligenaceae bacterium]|nr:MAG: hypothetical protein EON54_03425 [Alcaligenaceae bacterium]